jgi:ABC-type multidrug transport system ATPase subunit
MLIMEVIMKYECGNVLLLNNGKTVFVVEVDENKKEYGVVNTDNENEIVRISDRDVFQQLT